MRFFSLSLLVDDRYFFERENLKILCIYRDERFSPNSVEKDRAILHAVSDRLQARGYEVRGVTESRWTLSDERYSLVLNMGRLPETLDRLSVSKICTINAPEGIARCTRSRLQKLMAQNDIPVPPSEGLHGYWLKRGDASAQSQKDVVFVKDRDALSVEIETFRERGITDYTVSAHVQGDLVKFYGVRGMEFFRYYYPTDDGDTKFFDECHNGQAQHYPFDVDEMHRQVEQLASVVGIDIYGGDCIVREDGSWCVIDFNDWPSFSRCREEAAEAIVRLVESQSLED